MLFHLSISDTNGSLASKLPLTIKNCMYILFIYIYINSPNVMYYLVWIGSVSGGFGYWRSEIFFVGGSLCNAVAF